MQHGSRGGPLAWEAAAGERGSAGLQQPAMGARVLEMRSVMVLGQCFAAKRLYQPTWARLQLAAQLAAMMPSQHSHRREDGAPPSARHSVTPNAWTEVRARASHEDAPREKEARLREPSAGARARGRSARRATGSKGLANPKQQRAAMKTWPLAPSGARQRLRPEEGRKLRHRRASKWRQRSMQLLPPRNDLNCPANA